MTNLIEGATDIREATSADTRCGQGLHLVMADDSRADQHLVQCAAERAGIEAHFSFHDDGAWLMRHLSMAAVDDLPDLIVLDLQMPNLDGLGVLAELQADPVLSQVPVLVLTSAAGPGDRAVAHAAGATSFDLKPTSFDDLVSLVATFPELARGTSHPNLGDVSVQPDR